MSLFYISLSSQLAGPRHTPSTLAIQTCITMLLGKAAKKNAVSTLNERQEGEKHKDNRKDKHGKKHNVGEGQHHF